MRFPVDNPYKITTRFSASHPGIDIAPIPAGKLGVACYAPEKGTVIASNYKPALEGEYIILKGNSGKYYYFGHFARGSRRYGVGASVNEGDVLATLGMTGKADGVHTHFEVRTSPNGGQIDPLSINWEGEDVAEVEKWKGVAQDRLNDTRDIANAVSVNYRDANDKAQVINNIKAMAARIDELTKIVSDYEKKPVGNFKPLGKEVYVKD